jgi:hypothetical protein
MKLLNAFIFVFERPIAESVILFVGLPLAVG